MKLTHEGKEYEIKGYGPVLQGDHWISGAGFVYGPADGRGLEHETRLIVTPVRRKHVFGGVKFVETGEVRFVHKGEWYVSEDGNRKGYWDHPAKSDSKVIILKQVSLEHLS